MTAAQQIHTLAFQSQTWFHDCLVLYDVYWSTTAALVQICLMRKHRQETKEPWSTKDKARELNYLRLILTARFQIQKHVFDGVGIERGTAWTAGQLESLLDHGLCATCAKDHCKCFDYHSVVLQDLVWRHSLSICRRTWMCPES